MAKNTPKVLDHLQDQFGKVEEIKKTLAPEEADLETTRSQAWKMLGGEPFGAVKLGGFRFSKMMLVIGAAFVGMIGGFAIAAPTTGVLIAACVVAGGIYWIKSSLSA